MFVMAMVEVSAFRVRLVTVAIFQVCDPVPVTVQVPDPMVRVRVLLLLEVNVVAVTLKLLALSVPLLSVIPADELNASCIVKVPPNIWTVTATVNVLPAVVNSNASRPLNEIA